jgi:hypothetical protein
MTHKQGCCPGRQGERRADFPIGREALNALTVRRGGGNGEYGAEGDDELRAVAVCDVEDARLPGVQRGNRGSRGSVPPWMSPRALTRCTLL